LLFSYHIKNISNKSSSYWWNYDAVHHSQSESYVLEKSSDQCNSDVQSYDLKTKHGRQRTVNVIHVFT
jgi:hypothetical protein